MNRRLPLAFLAAAAFGLGPVQGALVSNAEFEMGADGWTLTPGYSIVKGEGRSMTAALVYENGDPAFPYAQPKQPVQLKPGKVYRFSAWIRTEDVVPQKGVGASVCLECQNADGKTLKWFWTTGIKGSSDWKKIEGVSRPIPENTVSSYVSVFCSPGSTGKAYFDDVEVAERKMRPVDGLYSSAYRNEAAEGRVDFKAAICVPEEFSPCDMKAVFSYKTSGKKAGSVTVAPLSRDEASFTCNVADLAMGKSKVGFRLLAPNGAKLGEAALTFHRQPAMPRRRVYIDSHNRTIVDGRPFFPLGMFTGGKNGRETYVKGPFNCVMPYSAPDAEGMDFYHTNGVMVIYSLKDIYYGTSRAPKNVRNAADERNVVRAKVSAAKSHPGLLAWYLNDELSISMRDRLAARRNLLESLDPEHPTWSVVYQIENLREYMPTFDVIGTDPYPVPERPLSMVSDWTRKTWKGCFGSRPVWQVPQAFEAWKPGSRMPTAEEMRRMSWQCIAAGANGLIYYTYGTLHRKTNKTPFDKAWADVCAAAGEVRRYIPVLLSVEPAPDVAGIPPEWDVRVWRKGGETYLLAVNSQEKPASAVLEIAEDFMDVRTEFGAAAQKSGQRGLFIALGANEPALYRIK